MKIEAPTPSATFLRDGGAMGALMRTHDWHATPFGAPETWPQSLRTMVAACLNSPMLGTILWGPDLRMLYNDGYIPSMGERHPEALGRPVREVWGSAWDEVAPAFVEVMASGCGMLQKGVPLTVLRHGKTETTYWDFTATPIRGEDGRIVGLFNQGAETTAQVLASQRQAFRLAVADSMRACPDAPTLMQTVVDAIGRHFKASCVGFREVQDDGEHIRLDARYVDGVEPSAQPVGPVSDDASVMSVPLVRDDQLAATLVVSHRQPRHWLPEDLTLVEEVASHAWQNLVRIRAEVDLRRAKETLETRVVERTQALVDTLADRDRIWRNSHDLITVIDLEGVLLSINPAAQEILGWLPQEMIGRKVTDFIHPQDQPPLREGKLIADIYRSAQIFHNRFLCKDGSHRSFAWSPKIEGDIIYSHGRDVTLEREQAAALKAAEDNLRQSQKMEAIGQLTGGIAHDFNNLLTVIRTSIDLLRRPNLSEDRRQRFMASIANAVTRAAKLTGQLLAFARRQALQPVVFDAAENVATIADMIETLVGSRVRVELVDSSQVCTIDADPGQFDTAIVNLAVNARDAMKGAGVLSIRTTQTSGIPAMRSRPFIEGDFVAVSVSDTGSGIAPENLDRVFEPFFTTKAIGQGTGLGLSQVFGFVKQSGGDVQVQSEPGKGTTFTIYLPLASRPAAEARAEDSHEAAAAPTKGHVLVVEDNTDVAISAEATLVELGYDVTVAAGGEQALALLADNPRGFAVVFSDVVMAGINGVELGREIRRLYGALPVVLSSGYSDVLAGNVDHGFPLLPKPYSVGALTRVLREAIAHSGSTERPALQLAAFDTVQERDHENARLAELDSLAVLDTDAEPGYDDLTRVAATLFEAPIALISLIDSDRQWFKSRVGLPVRQTPREQAFCAHAIDVPTEVMVVADASKDTRFSANPLVTGDPGIRFYAGAPLVTASGHAVGTLCVIDTKPRDPDPKRLEALEALARQVVGRLEAGRDGSVANDTPSPSRGSPGVRDEASK